MELVIASKMHKLNGHWYTPYDIDPATLREIKENVNDIMIYMDGYCFRTQAVGLKISDGIEWVVRKIGPELFSEVVCVGSAFEVDNWCKEARDHPFWDDNSEPHYSVVWRRKEDVL